jgi:hypothetical protein
MNDSPNTSDDPASRRHDDLGRDLEVLLERLAESREAIVRLLAARSGDDEAVADPVKPSAAWPPEPEASSPTVGEAGPLEPRLDSDVTPSQLRRPGPPALELALIYRHIADNGVGVLHEDQPGAVAEGPATTGPEVAGRAPWARPEGVGPSNTRDAATGPRGARRQLLAVVLVAVGAVVLLTTVVSLLPTLVNSI